MHTSRTTHRFTVLEYHRMQAAEIFDAGARIELIAGDLIETVMPMNPPHASLVVELTQVFTATLAPLRACIRPGVPITLGELSEPQPDIAIVKAPNARYRARHPAPADIHALIELSETSRTFDLEQKVPLYATFGIAEVWVVDIAHRITHVFRTPKDQRYCDHSEHPWSDPMSFSAFPDVAVTLSTFAPPAPLSP